jgi:hypothetical protein
MRSDHARLDVNRFQWHDVLFSWIVHHQNIYLVDEICFDDVDLWIDASINQIRVVKNVENWWHRRFLRNVYDRAHAICDVINQFENDVFFRKKMFNLNQINVFYATFFEIMQQSEMRDVVEDFDYVQQ